MDWVDTKYITILGGQLRNFKQKSHSLYNFSCPFCGDSVKNKFKARCYLFDRGGNTLLHCHNCGVTKPFPVALKELDPGLHKQYLVDRVSNRQGGFVAVDPVRKRQPPLIAKNGLLGGLKRVSVLSDRHPVRQYVLNRKIPPEFHYKLFAAPNFMTWVNTIFPGKFSEDALRHDSQRLLIPFFNQNKVVHAMQGRAIDDDTVRYITIMVDDRHPAIYGLDGLNLGKRAYVFEGPFDSMFVPNSIATAGHDLGLAVRGFDRGNLVIVYDNEPRSVFTKKKMLKAVNLNYHICVWPDGLTEKDVNAMILSGYSSERIQTMIDDNTYSGLQAQARILQWTKA